MKRIEKVKVFVKDHWKEIAVGAGIVVIGGITYVLFRKKPDFENVNLELPDISDWSTKEQERISKLNWGIGEMTDLWDEGGFINTVVNNVPISKLGDFGEELKKIGTIADDSLVDMVIGLKPMNIK